MNRQRVAAMIALIVALGIAGTAFALRDRGGSRNASLSVTATATTTTGPIATTTLAATTTAGVTTMTAAPPSTTVAPAPSTTAIILPPTAVTTGVTRAPPAPAGGAGTGSLRGRTIVIDPGHDGGNYAHTSEISRLIFIGTQTRACDTTGTATNDGYSEAAYNLDVALRLRDVLQAAGAHVVMTRTTNNGWGPCIDQRAAIGNDAHADAAISVHADGGPAGGRGFHVLMPANIPGYTDDIYATSHRLGVDVRDAFLGTGMPTSTYYASQGLAERTDLGGLNLSNVPKVFIETGNMRNATDAALLESGDFRQREAEDLAGGLSRFLAGR
jgi:N-acetylmuramoyl-L-alanine amidase